MQIPYFLMSGLYLLLAAMATLDSSLVSLGWMPAFAGIKWMRVHFITLGVLTQMIFGLLPAMTAKGLRLPKPGMNWASWLLYNGGLAILLIGLPVVDRTMIITGGTMIFIAVLVLMKDLIGLRREAIAQYGRTVCNTYSTTRFYLAGLSYLLVGVLVGTGLWIGWAEPLHIVTPKEVHVHANLWGYTAMIFAGLIFEFFPPLTRIRLFGRGDKGLRLDMLVFGSMALGALGLVSGPWLGLNWPAVVGLALHTVGTLLLLAYLIFLLLLERSLRQAGAVHLVSAYLWLLVPVVVAPYIVAKASENFPVAEVAGKGGPILIYGWILTFILAVIPYFLSLAFRPEHEPGLGGKWRSLVFMHLGSVLFWVGLFLPSAQNGLHAAAFLAWLVGLAPLLRDLYGQSRRSTDRLERTILGSLPGDPRQIRPGPN